jgi:hypothetical protein
MKSFDLDAARRGEPIQVLYDDKWIDTHFVGTTKIGLIVVQGNFRCGEFSTWGYTSTRMAPKLVTKYLNVYGGKMKGSYVGHDACVFDNEADAKTNADRNASPILLRAAPIEVEVE